MPSLAQVSSAFSVLYKSLKHRPFTKSKKLENWDERDLLPLVRFYLLGKFGPIVGVVGWLLGGLTGSGDIVIKHYILRIALRLKNELPLRYEHFLEYATGLILVRKVVGGCDFVHRMMMMHFAGLENQDIERMLDAISRYSKK